MSTSSGPSGSLYCTIRRGRGSAAQRVQSLASRTSYKLATTLAVLQLLYLPIDFSIAMASSNDLRPITRLITTHDADGKSVLCTALDEKVPQTTVNDGDAFFALSYLTQQFPVDMNDDKDINAYTKYLINAPGLVNNTGTVVRIVDMRPGLLSPMHRTVSLDLGIVLEGDVELVLDSGETKRMLPGDQCVQRGTMHAWRNCSDTKWSRMVFVLQPSHPITVGGEKLGEDLADMKGVRASS